ncbi:MAG: prolipoprotein diacylglyceryl transferase, partial [Candidatus Melainabacteria bacterium HGW-Melainabacteria-1]
MIYEHNLSSSIVKLGPLEPRWYALMYILGFVFLY